MIDRAGPDIGYPDSHHEIGENMIRKNPLSLAIPLSLALLAAGCTGEKGSATVTPPGAASAASLPEGAILASPPAGAKPLPDVKQSAKKGDTVTFVARIGGRLDPFVKGRAMMVVIDPKIPSCADMGEEDHCPSPWDYCCESQESITRGTATVQFVGADGKPLAVSIEGQSGLEPLATVTITGVVAEKDEGGTFVVNATGVHVAKKG